MMFVCKTHRQHNSIVMTIPKKVCGTLKIKTGDYVTLVWCAGSEHFEFMKLKKTEVQHGKGGRDKNRRDTGGQT